MQQPHRYHLDENLNSSNPLNYRYEFQAWPSRSIVDLRLNYNNEIYAGTGGGLGKFIHTENQIDSYNAFADANLPIGGTPSIIIENFIESS